MHDTKQCAGKSGNDSCCDGGIGILHPRYPFVNLVKGVDSWILSNFLTNYCKVVRVCNMLCLHNYYDEHERWNGE